MLTIFFCKKKIEELEGRVVQFTTETNQAIVFFKNLCANNNILIIEDKLQNKDLLQALPDLKELFESKLETQKAIHSLTIKKLTEKIAELERKEPEQLHRLRVVN